MPDQFLFEFRLGSWNTKTNFLLGGYIKPIYKNKRDKLDPNNFRPITILRCVSKLFTGILNERLNKFSDDFFYIKQEPNGFPKKVIQQ
jgi:hypothetical protein